MHHILLIHLILPLILPAIATNSPSDSRTCYLMNGDVAPALSPCRPPSNTSNDKPQTTTHSACCRLRNSTTSSSDTDDLSPATCLEPSGLCLSRNGLMYISGCTDATWKDPACPSMCPDRRTQFKGKALEDKHWNQGKQVTRWQVMVCAPQNICCRRFSNNDDCCGNDTLRVEGVDVGGPKVGWWDYNGDGDNNDSESGNGNATEARTGTGSRPTGCQRESGKAGDGENDAEQCEPCHEATVGAAVGAPLGAAFVATLAALAWAIRRQKVAEKRLAGVQAQASMLSSEYYKPPGVRQVQKLGNHAELSAMRQYELDGGTSTHR